MGNQAAADEHLSRPLYGTTQTICSCGNTFGTSDEARQHRDWHLQLAVADRDYQNQLRKVLESLKEMAESGTFEGGRYDYVEYEAVSVEEIDKAIEQIGKGE